MSARKELEEVLPHLSDEILDWAPSAGMRTIHGQFVEIMSTEVEIRERIVGGPRREYKEVEEEFLATVSVDGLVAKLSEVRGATLAHLSSLDDAGLRAPVAVSEGFSNWLCLESVPASELFRYIARHEAYHTGQLVSYLWSRGNDPYSW